MHLYTSKIFQEPRLSARSASTPANGAPVIELQYQPWKGVGPCLARIFGNFWKTIPGLQRQNS